MKKSKLRKIIKEEIQKLKEGSYDDFIDSYAREIQNARKLIKKGHKITDAIEGGDDEYASIFQRWENTYDEMIIRGIDEWFWGGRLPSVSDIAKLAMKNQDRNGTEMKMIIYAIEEYYELLKKI